MTIQALTPQALDFWNTYGKELISVGGTVVASLLGALFAVIAVDKTNRANQKNLKLQLENDRALKKEAYELETKRAVYMDVATTIQLQLNLIDNMADLDKTHSDLYAVFNDVQGALAKMHLIAAAKSLESFITAQTEAAASVFNLYAERNRLMEIHHTAQQIRRDINDQVALRKSYTSMYPASDINGTLDKNRYEAISKAIGLCESTIKSLQESLERITNGHQADKRAFVLECTRARMRVEELLPPLVIAVRQELRIEFDGEDYAALMADARNAQRQVIEKAMSPGA